MQTLTKKTKKTKQKNNKRRNTWVTMLNTGKAGGRQRERDRESKCPSTRTVILRQKESTKLNWFVCMCVCVGVWGVCVCVCCLTSALCFPILQEGRRKKKKKKVSFVTPTWQSTLQKRTRKKKKEQTSRRPAMNSGLSTQMREWMHTKISTYHAHSIPQTHNMSL